jgi:hemerythrin
MTGREHNLNTFVSWNESFSVKNKTLDAQHTRLVGMLNALSNSIERRETQSVLVLLLNGLIQYTQAHFAAEEELLAKHGFPGLAEHRAEHQAMTARVLEFRREFESGNREIAQPLLLFLREWLTHHILETDQNYAAFLHTHEKA